MLYFFFFQAEDGIRDGTVTGVQTCALPILVPADGDHAGEEQLVAAWPELAEVQGAGVPWRGPGQVLGLAVAQPAAAPADRCLAAAALASPGRVPSAELRARRAEPSGQHSPDEAGLARPRCRQRRAHPGVAADAPAGEPLRAAASLARRGSAAAGSRALPASPVVASGRRALPAGAAGQLAVQDRPELGRQVLAEGHGGAVRPDRRTGTMLPEPPAAARGSAGADGPGLSRARAAAALQVRSRARRR